MLTLRLEGPYKHQMVKFDRGKFITLSVHICLQHVDLNTLRLRQLSIALQYVPTRSLLPQRDRATRCVSRSLVNCRTTV